MVELNAIISQGKRIDYDYSYSREISKFFSAKPFFVEYDVDITEVPEGILAIPFLANILPIAWFAGFDVKVKTLDKAFYDSMESVKKQFAEYYPEINSKQSNLIVENLEDYSQNNTTSKNAMLFSGGVDAYTAYLRHYDENPDLITIRGADMAIDDIKQWNDILAYNDTTEIIKNNSKYYIASNIREFITFEVDKLLPDLGWWGKIQHGLSLTCLVAPLSFLNNYETLYIASSYTRKKDYEVIIWGSMPEIDNKIFWTTTIVKHDAEELTRQEKIDFVTSKSKSLVIAPQLRVCYNEFKTTLNCSECEKCLRTIFAIMINNANPNDYGFNTDISVFGLLHKKLKSGFSSQGNRLFWKEIYEKAISTNKYYNDEEKEWKEKYQEFLQNLTILLDKEINTPSKLKRVKLSIINKFPKLFKIYLNIRRKL